MNKGSCFNLDDDAIVAQKVGFKIFVEWFAIEEDVQFVLPFVWDVLFNKFFF